ncbi:hypothetical protein [Nocardia sp. NBC_01388]|uniref:hypothetical protein n=1 Tax=Nocardia sp. NBC_01388 TaxID=2903596 RepID=UPI00324DEAE6
MAEKPNARKWAREVTARLMAEQACALRENETDLTEFRKQHSRWERARQRRDAAIAAVDARYRQSEADAEAGAAAAVRRLHGHGMAESQLCEITGLSLARVPDPVLERPRPMPDKPDEDTEREPGQSGGDRPSRGQDDREQ